MRQLARRYIVRQNKVEGRQAPAQPEEPLVEILHSVGPTITLRLRIPGRWPGLGKLLGHWPVCVCVCSQFVPGGQLW